MDRTIFGIFEDDQTCMVPEEGCDAAEDDSEDCDDTITEASAQQHGPNAP